MLYLVPDAPKEAEAFIAALKPPASQLQDTAPVSAAEQALKVGGTLVLPLVFDMEKVRAEPFFLLNALRARHDAIHPHVLCLPHHAQLQIRCDAMHAGVQEDGRARAADHVQVPRDVLRQGEA